MRFVTVICICLLPLFISAQRFEMSSFVGYSSYQGDLNESPVFSLQEAHLSYGLKVSYLVNQNISVGYAMYNGGISGSDQNFPNRRNWDPNLSFKSIFSEHSMMVTYFPVNRTRGGLTSYKVKGKSNGCPSVRIRYKRKYSPYVYGGLGVVALDPVVSGLPRGSEELQPGAYSNTHLVLPFGGGMRMELTKKIGISAEFGMRYPFSDYIDGVSDSRSPEFKDWYIVGGLRVAYKFHNFF